MTATATQTVRPQRPFPTSESQTKALAKITKLLAVAHDQAGTKEAEAFHEMAMKLMADYAIDEARLAEYRGEESSIVERQFRIERGYRRHRGDLLIAIVDALHCTAVMLGLGPQPELFVVFGKRHHVDRVALLYHYLVLDMVAGADRHARQLEFSGAMLRRMKESWMVGYAQRIHERLTEIEYSAADDCADGSASSMSLALVNDRENANAARDQRFPDCVSHVRRRKVATESFRAGCVAAETADLQQTRVESRNTDTSDVLSTPPLSRHVSG